MLNNKCLIQLLLITCCLAEVAAAQIPYRAVPDSFIAPRTIEVTHRKTCVIVFPSEIKRVDRGTPELLAGLVEGVTNALKLKAANDSISATNLHVFTADGNVYPFNVYFNPDPAALTVSVPNASRQNVQPGFTRFLAPRMNDHLILTMSHDLMSSPPFLKKPRSKSIFGARAALNGVYYSEGVLFVHFQINNAAQLPYDLDFFRFYIRDRKKGKRTAIMEKEIHPLYTGYSFDRSIPPDSSGQLVVAFDKFTIAEGKIFAMEVFEKNGDRHLTCKLKGRHLLRARPVAVSTRP